MKGKTGLVVISKIPQDEVQEISGKKVEIANLIFDEKKNVIKSRIGKKDFTKFPKKDIYYYSLSSLSPGKYESRVVMRNLETGKAAVASSSVNIPEIPDFGIMLNPPLLLVPGKNAYYLEGNVIERKEEEGGPIDLIKVFPCNFSNFTPVIEELAEGTTRLLAVMNCTAYKITKPEIELLVSLIHQDTGKKLPLNFSILDVVEENGRKIFYLQLQTPELTPGKYKLELAAIETNTQSESYTDLTFMVR